MKGFIKSRRFVNGRRFINSNKRLAGVSVVIVSLLLPFMLTSCATKVQYGDAQAVETVDTDFGSTDLQATAAKMVESLLTFHRLGARVQFTVFYQYLLRKYPLF